jgi:hypothetical protein
VADPNRRINNPIRAWLNTNVPQDLYEQYLDAESVMSVDFNYQSRDGYMEKGNIDKFLGRLDAETRYTVYPEQGKQREQRTNFFAADAYCIDKRSAKSSPWERGDFTENEAKAAFNALPHTLECAMDRYKATEAYAVKTLAAIKSDPALASDLITEIAQFIREDEEMYIENERKTRELYAKYADPTVIFKHSETMRKIMEDYDRYRSQPTPEETTTQQSVTDPSLEEGIDVDIYKKVLQLWRSSQPTQDDLPTYIDDVEAAQFIAYLATHCKDFWMHYAVESFEARMNQPHNPELEREYEQTIAPLKKQYKELVDEQYRQPLAALKPFFEHQVLHDEPITAEQLTKALEILQSKASALHGICSFIKERFLATQPALAV